MKTYTVTDKPYTGKLTTSAGIVYQTVQQSGTNGISREDFTKKVEGLMVLSGAYHRLNDLVKDGFVSVSGQTQARKPWGSPTGRLTRTEPDIQNIPGTPAHALEMNIARGLVRKPFKWRCPSCSQWVLDPISKSCLTCRPRVDTIESTGDDS